MMVHSASYQTDLFSLSGYTADLVYGVTGQYGNRHLQTSVHLLSAWETIPLPIGFATVASLTRVAGTSGTADVGLTRLARALRQLVDSRSGASYKG